MILILIWMLWRLRNEPMVNRLFKKEFRNSSETFEVFVNLVRLPLEKKETIFKHPYFTAPGELPGPISVKKRLAIALWRLATENGYRKVSEKFVAENPLLARQLINFVPYWQCYHQIILISQIQTMEQPL